MQDQSFRNELSIVDPATGYPEWWTFGMDIMDDMIDMHITYGGIRQDSVPLHVAKEAAKQWATWIQEP
ncbi:hypothetical protein [Luteolibacter luteus]|uniref:Uncharacterized protein n=1 Tax=Luteolibacter luteus TaxID=2728835 RepID=A0A858RNA4_9BACT|nr:hypothetical protein [Luteolibacter luteus]QJE98886.1 hypothetical protein HHL09_24930 [Luteolibacter luteus]